MVVEGKYGGYVLKDMNMIQDLEVEQGKKNQVVALTAILTEGTLPKIELIII